MEGRQAWWETPVVQRKYPGYGRHSHSHEERVPLEQCQRDGGQPWAGVERAAAR